MAAISFSVARQKLSFRESLRIQAFEIFTGGETKPFAVARTNYGSGNPRGIIRFEVLQANQQSTKAYLTDSFDSIGFSSYGSGYGIFPESSLTQRIGFVFSPTRWQYALPASVPSLFDCPTVLSMIHKADRQILDGKDQRQIAELHHAWRDSELARGVKGTFLIPPGLSPEMHLLAVLSAAAETIFHEEP